MSTEICLTAPTPKPTPPAYAEQDLETFYRAGIDKVVMVIPYDDDSLDAPLVNRHYAVPIGNSMPLVFGEGSPTLTLGNGIEFRVNVRQRHQRDEKSTYGVLRRSERSMRVEFNPSAALPAEQQPASVEAARLVTSLVLCALARDTVNPSCYWDEIPLRRLDVTRDFKVKRAALYVEGLARLRRSGATRSALWLHPRTAAAQSFYTGGSHEHVKGYDKSAERGDPAEPGGLVTWRWEAHVSDAYLRRCLRDLPRNQQSPSLAILGIPHVRYDEGNFEGVSVVAAMTAEQPRALDNVAEIARERWLHSRYYHRVSDANVVAHRAVRLIEDVDERQRFLHHLRAKHLGNARDLQGPIRERYEAWEAETGAPWGSPFGPGIAGSMWWLNFASGVEKVKRYPISALAASAPPPPRRGPLRRPQRPVDG